MINYFFFIGVIYLIMLTWQDFKNNMLVDDRRNWFMLGLAISVYSHVYTTLLYKLGLTVAIIILNVWLRKSKAVGEADINSLSWIFLGLGLMHYSFLIVFVVIFSVITVLWHVLKKIAYKNASEAPFYHVILISFIITGWLVGGFLA